MTMDPLFPKPAPPPPRIYGWLDSQMSIARYYGGLQYQGHDYVIAFDEEGQPLVRADVLRAEAKARKAAEKKQREAVSKLQTPLI